MSSWFWQNRSFKAVAVIRRLSNRRSDLYQIIWPKPNHLGWVNPDMFISMNRKNDNASSNENLLLEGRAVIFKTVKCHELNRLNVWNRKSGDHSCGHSYQHFIHWWNDILPFLTETLLYRSKVNGSKVVEFDECEAYHITRIKNDNLWSMSSLSLTFEKIFIGLTVPVNKHINAVIELNHSIVIFCHFIWSHWRRVLVVNSPIRVICFK